MFAQRKVRIREINWINEGLLHKTIDQQELIRYEREKASLTDKLREMNSLLTGVKEMFEKEAAEERLLEKK